MINQPTDFDTLAFMSLEPIATKIARPCRTLTPYPACCQPTQPSLTTPFVSTVSSEKPNLPQLFEVDLPSRVALKINAFGTFLLEDDLGNKLEIIRRNHQGRVEEMTMEVLREWLAGKGVEVSWESLIATLRKSKLKLMADQIQIALDQLRS